MGNLSFGDAGIPFSPYVLFSPSPRPALAERSSHAGEGGGFCFILPGASPPAPPRPRRERRGIPDSLRYLKTHAGSGTGSRYLPGNRRRRPFRYKKVFASFREGAAKERGDRGRGTSAFEMIPSPGAGQRYATGAGVRKSYKCPSNTGGARNQVSAAPCAKSISEKFLGVWGLLSRSPQRFPRSSSSLIPPKLCDTQPFCAGCRAGRSRRA